MSSTQLQDLPLDTKVYYTGDAANREGFFKVVKHDTTIWGEAVDLSEVDTPSDVGGPRSFLGVALVAFDEAPGRRFVPHAELHLGKVF